MVRFFNLVYSCLIWAEIYLQRKSWGLKINSFCYVSFPPTFSSFRGVGSDLFAFLYARTRCICICKWQNASLIFNTSVIWFTCSDTLKEREVICFTRSSEVAFEQFVRASILERHTSVIKSIYFFSVWILCEGGSVLRAFCDWCIRTVKGAGIKPMTKPAAFFNGSKKAEFLRECITQRSAALCHGKINVLFFLPKDIIFHIKIHVCMCAS